MFITASAEARARRVAQRDKLTEQESVKKIARVDKARAAYYNQHSGKEWGAAASYDLSVDTDKLGIDGAVDMIIAAVQKIEKR